MLSLPSTAGEVTHSRRILIEHHMGHITKVSRINVHIRLIYLLDINLLRFGVLDLTWSMKQFQNKTDLLGFIHSQETTSFVTIIPGHVHPTKHYDSDV